MMFVTPNTTVLGGRGFSIKRGSFRYLRTASGYPVTLHAPMPGKPKRITVYGAVGGVGDRTANFVRMSPSLPVTVNGVRLEWANDIFSISGTRTGAVVRGFANILDVEVNTTYTVQIIPELGNEVPPVYIYDNTNSSDLVSVNRNEIKTFTTRANTASIAIAYNSRPESHLSPEYKFRVMVVKGNYTTGTMPPYEPYGHKIPILAGNKTINLYTPQQLTARESRNLFDIDSVVSGRNLGDVGNDYSASGYWISDFVSVKPDTTYTLVMSDNNVYAWTNIAESSGRNKNDIYIKTISKNIKSNTMIEFTTKSTTNFIRFGGKNTWSDVMLLEGSYTAETMPAYEPYGTLYDTLTVADNAATLSPKATGGDDTDVTALQDWAQDMTLPEADELTVSAGTAIEPERIEVEYYSKMKGDN